MERPYPEFHMVLGHMKCRGLYAFLSGFFFFSTVISVVPLLVSANRMSRNVVDRTEFFFLMSLSSMSSRLYGFIKGRV